MSSTPVAVFTYNRPQHTRQMLDSLAKCSRLDECKVFIFSDGPAIPEHAEGVQETRRVIHDWMKHCPARVVERGGNWGLARSIVGGVSELCEEYGRVIVVEDDLVLHPAFLHFMLSALDHYIDDENVSQVSGYMFPVQNSLTPDAFFLPFISTWGWGTWARAWKLFNWDASSALTELQNRETRQHFDLEASYPYTQMLFNRLEGKNQSWGILFYWSVFNSQKLALYPRRSLVNNVGFDSGIHHHRNSVKFTPLVDMDIFLPNNVDPVWPESTEVDGNAYQKIQEYLRDMLKTKSIAPKSSKTKLQRLLGRFLLNKWTIK